MFNHKSKNNMEPSPFAVLPKAEGFFRFSDKAATELAEK